MTRINTRTRLSFIWLASLLAGSYGNALLAEEAIPVVAKPLATLAIYPQIKAPASVISNNDSHIYAEVNARIIDIPARVGDIVNQGDIIVRLEKRDFQLAVDREQAELAALAARVKLADYELKRAQSLAKKQAVSEQLLKQREAELDTLLAQQQGQRIALEQAKRDLDKSDIRAPFQAVITERLGQVGELTTPGTALLRIVDMASLEVSAEIQAHHAQDIIQSRSLTLLSAGNQYPLQLRAITPVIDNKTRTREARLLFQDQGALPGSAGELIWEQSLTSLPGDLLIKRQGKLGVFTLHENKAHFVAIPNAEEGRPATTDLANDTLIITEGRYRLQDGDTVVSLSDTR